MGTHMGKHEDGHMGMHADKEEHQGMHGHAEEGHQEEQNGGQGRLDQWPARSVDKGIYHGRNALEVRTCSRP
jgi:hypothetical protein